MKNLCALLIPVAITACEGAQDYTPAISGPRTKDADAFAIAYLDAMQERSFAANREHCGLFGRDAQGYVIASPPYHGRT